MLFNSVAFLKFFAAFVLLFWLARNNLRVCNALIVAASLLFYAWWSPGGPEREFPEGLVGGVLRTLWQCRFLSLLLATSILDFCVGRGLQRLQTNRARRTLLALSVTANLSVLGFFKYCDFFISSTAHLLHSFGVAADLKTLGIVLPVGISFYTFQSMSYAIDVYRRELVATRSFVNFLAYVSFFPQLVAGPIERARHLQPQFERERVITRPMLEEGFWLLLWGMFKKVALADNFAPLVEIAYGQKEFTAPVVVLGTIAFALQIYCDFSGYSDIARGTARLLGFDIMWNFNLPYFALSIRDFWRRWHISLSTWLRDYLYISLGGNRHGATRTCFNLMLTMFLGGLWHGASWHFVLFGLWHGLGLVAFRWRQPQPELSAGRFSRGLSWIGTMLFVLYGWLLFRAESYSQVRDMTLALTHWSAGPAWVGSFVVNIGVFLTPLVVMEIAQARAKNPLVALSWPPWRRTLVSGGLVVGILLFWQQRSAPFIYFQF